MYDLTVRDTTKRPASRGVRVEGLGKRFGDLWALRDLHVEVPAGTVLGLLGHNGAGKTTAIRILTTLSQPTEGRATVAGFDVATDGAALVRIDGETVAVDCPVDWVTVSEDERVVERRRDPEPMPLLELID